MPIEDFFTGTILFAVMLLAVLATTGLIVQRRLGHLDRIERLLASVVIGTAVLIGVHLVPLLLGILNRGTVIAAGLLAIALATRVQRAQPSPAEDRGPPAPPSGRLDWAVAGVAAAIAAVAAVADLGRWAGDELVGVDPLTFHLPNIARWIQTGSLWQIDQFVPQLAHGNYPNNGDVVLLSTVLPWHNDFLVRAPIFFFLVVTAFAAAAVARELRAPAAAAVLAGAAVVSIPIVGLASIPRALPDSLLWATYACGVLFLLRHARTSRRADLALAGVALAVAFGTKWYGISSVGVLVVVWTVARMLQRDPAPTVAAGAEDAAAGAEDAAAGAEDAAAGAEDAAAGAEDAAAGAEDAAAGAEDAAAGAEEAGAAPAPRRRLARPALLDGLFVGGIALLGDGAWLARNLVESSNPVFPVKIAPLGVTILDAPRDVIVEQVGFSILDYLGDPPVLRQLAGEVFDGLGVLAIVCLLGIGAAALAWRREPDRRIVLMIAAAIALVPVYAWLPGTALGNPGDPSLASVNTRYAVPILLLLTAVVAWTVGRLPRVLAVAFEVALLVAIASGAYSGYEVSGARDVVLAAIGLSLVAAAGWALWRMRRRPVVIVTAAVAAALVLLAGAHRIEERVNDGRYLGGDPAIDALLKAAPGGKRIGLAADWSVGGLTPIWPAFGTRIGNEVEYIGYFDGFLRKYPTKARFQAALADGDYDFIVVGRGFYPPQDTREQGWAIDGGWTTVALSRRLRVLTPPR